MTDFFDNGAHDPWHDRVPEDSAANWFYYAFFWLFYGKQKADEGAKSGWTMSWRVNATFKENPSP